MKKFLKVSMVACGFIFAVAASTTKAKAQESVVAPGEGCRGEGECGTTPGGVKLNGSYTVWP